MPGLAKSTPYLSCHRDKLRLKYQDTDRMASPGTTTSLYCRAVMRNTQPLCHLDINLNSITMRLLFALLSTFILTIFLSGQVVTYEDFKSVIPLIQKENFKGAYKKTTELLNSTKNYSSDLRGEVNPNPLKTWITRLHISNADISIFIPN